MFVRSYGFGVGMGSFRSSSMLIAIIGSVGVPGTYLFFRYIWKVLRPDKAASYSLRQSGDEAIAAAFGWATVTALIPAILSGSSPDPGASFAFFCAYAVATRRAVKAQQDELGELQTAPPAWRLSSGTRPRRPHGV